MDKNQSQEKSSVEHPIPSEKLSVEDVRFFAVGHGRSGTTWLERTLNTHPEVLCKGSGMFFGKNLESIGGRRLLHQVLLHSEALRSWHATGLNEWTDPEEYEQDAAQITRAVIDALMRRELTKSGKRILGDRTPHYVSHLPELHSIFPEARVVHAIRDGRDVAISNVHAFWKNSQRLSASGNLSPDELEIKDAYLEDRETFLAGGRSIFTEERIRQQARSWIRIVRRGRNTGKRLFGASYTELYYEAHLDTPHEALTELFGFLGADASPDVIDNVVEANRFEKLAGRTRGQEASGSFMRKGISGDWREVFTERDKRIFKEEAGELLVDLGYEEDHDW